VRFFNFKFSSPTDDDTLRNHGRNWEISKIISGIFEDPSSLQSSFSWRGTKNSELLP